MIDRIADFAHAETLAGHMRRLRAEAARAETQLASGLRDDSYAGLGTDSRILESLKAGLARSRTYVDVAVRASNLFDRQSLELGRARDTVLALRDTVLEAIGAGQALGLGEAASHTDDSWTGTLAAAHEGRPLFAATGALEYMIADAERIAANVDLGPADVLVAQALSGIAGVPDGPLTPADSAILRQAVLYLDEAARELTAAEATVGRRQNAAAAARLAASDRRDALEIAIEELNGVDPAEAITRLTQAQNALQASYTVLARLQSLNLAQYL